MLKLSELEEKLNSRIIEAYSIGLSVIEITIVINRNSAEYVHSLLRSRGYIDPFPANTRRRYDADRSLESALKSKSYSFAKWSIGWGLVASDAEIELAEKKPGKVKNAIHRDFPKIFSRLYGENAQPAIIGKKQYAMLRPTLLTAWDMKRKEYICSLLDDPSTCSAGSDYVDAAIQFESVYRATNRIKCLEDAIVCFKAGFH